MNQEIVKEKGSSSHWFGRFISVFLLKALSFLVRMQVIGGATHMRAICNSLPTFFHYTKRMLHF